MTATTDERSFLSRIAANPANDALHTALARLAAGS